MRTHLLAASLAALALPFALIGCDGGGSGSTAPAAPAATSSATLTATSIRGVVRRENQPVARAFLLVSDPSKQTVPELDPTQLFSDAEGRFAISVPPGRYLVTAVGP